MGRALMVPDSLYVQLREFPEVRSNIASGLKQSLAFIDRLPEPITRGLKHCGIVRQIK